MFITAQLFYQCGGTLQVLQLKRLALIDHGNLHKMVEGACHQIGKIIYNDDKKAHDKFLGKTVKGFYAVAPKKRKIG